MIDPKDITIDSKQLSDILASHKEWLTNDKGERANLQRADLRDANLQGADLRGADLRDANLQGADLRGADLRGAYLQDAGLQGADLRGADLQRAYLQGADLQGAYLQGADLQGADLQGAYLQGADLRDANLQDAGLQGADLQGADLRGADLRGADLRGAYLQDAGLQGADLQGADLQGAYLQGAKNIELAAAMVSICAEGDIIGWKKCSNNVIVKLLIPSDAKRSNATGRKCRAEFAKVLEVFGAEVGQSNYDRKVLYKVGEIVRPDKWDENRWDECSNGIHFFITREEAEVY